MAAIAAARATHALVAVPYFGEERQEKETDFNDLAGLRDGDRLIREDLAAAMLPNDLLQQILVDDPHAAHRKSSLKELAGLYQNDREFYEKLLAKLKGKIRVGEVDRQIKALIKAEAEARSAQPGIAAAAPPDMSTLAASAREIIECEDVLGLFIEDFSRFIVGEEAREATLSRIYDSLVRQRNACRDQGSIQRR